MNKPCEQIRVPKDRAVWIQWMDGDQIVGTHMALPRTTEALESAVQRIIDESIEPLEDWPERDQWCHVCENDTDTELHAPECPILKLTEALAVR